MNVSEILNYATKQLRHVTSQPQKDARIMLAHALSCTQEFLISNNDYELTENELDQFGRYLSRRKAYEPIQYITGRQSFFGFDFRVNRDVLIPRPETEILVETAKNIAESKENPVVLDIGTGSGIIAISLAKVLNKGEIWATDISESALSLAKENAKTLGVIDKINFVLSDFFRSFNTISGSDKTFFTAIIRNAENFHNAEKLPCFDLIISNPPYVSLGELSGLALELRYEPLTALTDFSDGLNSIREIIKAAKEWIKPKGFLLLEIGYMQKSSVRQLALSAGWNSVRFEKDLAGIERVAIISD
ncbi:MAG TPA: peptide chain release factor N(5)-glutamine methyltransferase [Pyrinomonadaceae bacterium]|nr:peptide chain release factor N(5)-glutamine methyltransferase [Pyrinomonadaceae bacterium]